VNEAREIVPARRETLIAPSPDDRVGRFTLRRLGIVQWIGVVIAPLAWTGQHVVGYGVGEARCNVAGVGWGIGYDTWQLAILAAAGLLVAISEAAAVAVFLATREVNYGDGPPEDGRWGGAVPYTRLHFFATAAMVANVLFLAAILMDGFAAVFDSLCVQS
jgi:hypothetical protein